MIYLVDGQILETSAEDAYNKALEFAKLQGVELSHILIGRWSASYADEFIPEQYIDATGQQDSGKLFVEVVKLAASSSNPYAVALAAMIVKKVQQTKGA